ncbi:hypothetical protein CHH28_07740 [Bacterioplanes sanyensis]|uniref:histidine kinase n=1 Tax=Bacterioplanes sanyensis TaxID=1249553 RepID=A0A222FIU2_9GAMM|nr:ATP-binding protein [Bacterioplanes sanyensis]ASP38572.1 hypothetical protein CHH28_07740 [Bacterioplanes sanyensis]
MNRIFLRLYLTVLLSCLLLAAIAAAAVYGQKQWRWQQYLEQQALGVVLLAADGLARHQGERQTAWLNALEQLVSPAQVELTSSPAAINDTSWHITVAGDHATISATISTTMAQQQQLHMTLDSFEPTLLRTALVLVLNDLGRYPATERQQRFQQLSRWFPAGLNRHPLTDVALSETQQRQLRAGEIITQLDTAQTTSMRVIAPLGNSGDVIQLGPVPLFDPYPAAWLVGIVGIALILLLLIGWWLNQRLAQRVHALQEGIALLGSERPHAITLPGQDEINAIADSVNRMQTRIINLVSAQRQLSNDIAHELRTPVARCLFRLQALQDQLALAQDHPLLVGIRRDLHNLNDLTAEILTQAQLEQHTPSHQPLALTPWLRDAIATTQNESGWHIELDLATNENLTVAAEPTLLKRALDNLISNARRYGSGQIAVAIRLEDDSQHVRVSIEDNGPGINSEHIHKVWQPFYRTDHSRQTATGERGFGLGLSMVKRIVEAHQGSVSIDRSATLGGCAVSIILPIITQKAVA